MNFALYRYDFIPVNNRQKELFPETLPSYTVEEAFENRRLILATIFKMIESGKLPLKFSAKKTRKRKAASAASDAVPAGKLAKGTPATIMRYAVDDTPSDAGDCGISPVFIHTRQEDDLFVMRLDKSRTVSYHPKRGSSKTETQDDWNSCHVIFDNRDEQQIAIQINKNAFERPDKVAAMIEHSLNTVLKHYHLEMHISPRGDSRAFWEKVNDKQRFPKGFKRIRIELPPPNSSLLKKNLMAFLTKNREGTNSALCIEYNAIKGGCVKLDPDNEFIASFINIVINVVDATSVKGIPVGERGYLELAGDSMRKMEIDNDMIAHPDNIQTLDGQSGADCIKELFNNA